MISYRDIQHGVIKSWPSSRLPPKMHYPKFECVKTPLRIWTGAPWVDKPSTPTTRLSEQTLSWWRIWPYRETFNIAILSTQWSCDKECKYIFQAKHVPSYYPPCYSLWWWIRICLLAKVFLLLAPPCGGWFFFWAKVFLLLAPRPLSVSFQFRASGMWISQSSWLD